MSPQRNIAHYCITAKLGEGGMGEVYRATDAKLNRDVAIKILPEAFAQDPDRMARFSREAQILASLNHPNIAAIYGIEERALVMELADGNLREELEKCRKAGKKGLPPESLARRRDCSTHKYPQLCSCGWRSFSHGIPYWGLFWGSRWAQIQSEQRWRQ